MADLTKEQKVNALSGIYTSAGMQVIFDMIEEIVTESENLLIGEDPDNERTVIKLQYRAHAQRMLFQKLADKIEFLVKEGKLPPPPVEIPRSLEERAQYGAEPMLSVG